MKKNFFIWGVLDIFLAFFFLQHFSFFTFQTFAETGEVLTGETSQEDIMPAELAGQQSGAGIQETEMDSGSTALRGNASQEGQLSITQSVSEESSIQEMDYSASPQNDEGGLIEEETTSHNDTMEQNTTENTPATGENITETGLNISEISPDNQVLSGSSITSGELLTGTSSRQSGQIIDTGVTTSPFVSLLQGEGSGGGVPQLQITEVYFDGYDERIEITNSGTGNFSGNLTLVGAKATDVVLQNVQIPGKTTVVVGDKLLMLTSPQAILQTGLKLNIYDTQIIDIQLLYSGTQIDTFQVNEMSVQEANDLGKTSFHRFSDTNEIVITSGKYTDNVLSGFTANSGKVWMSTDMGNTGTGTSTGTGGTMTGNIAIPHLLISEMYAYDKPYIEITNLSQTESFSGMIMLSGTLQNHNNLAQSISQSITLQPQQQIIFYTDPNIFENISQFSGIQADFSFLLDGASTSSSGNAHGLQLHLLYSGNVLDTFMVHNDRVQKLSGDFTSFEKIGSGIDSQNYITTYIGRNLDRVYNIKTPYLGNPGKRFMTAENSKDITQSIPDEPTPSAGLQVPVNCDDFRNPNQLTISEIFPGNQTYHPFIELENPGNIAESYEYLYLSGTALSGNVYYPTTNLEHNKMLLLTDTDARYNEGLDAVANADFALQNSGWITVYGMNYVYDDNRNIIDMEQDILDIVYYSGFTENKSLYYNTHDVQCGRIFDEVLNFSPTFDDKLLQFFSVESEPIVKTVYVGGGGGGCSYDRQMRFDPAPEQNTDPVEIKTIKYHSPELQQITLKSKSNEDINLRNYRLQTLNPLKYYPLKSRTLFAGQDKIMTGNFYLPRQDSCVNLLKDDVVIDRYCYARLSTLKIENLEDNLQDSQENAEEETGIVIQSESEESINGLPYLTITNIDYNPKGADTDSEKLYFAQDILSLFFDQTTGKERKKSDFALDIYKNNQLYKTKKFTDTTITQHGNNYLQGDFQLPNNNPSKQDIIVNLRYHQQVIARGSYNPYQDKNTFKAGEYLVSSVLDGDTFRIKHNGKTQSVRLLGVDAPESSIVRFGKAECFGKDAKKYLKSLINKKIVTLIPDSTTNSRDKFGRRLAYVYLGNISKENFINRQLLIKGYAKEYTYQYTNYIQQGNFKTLMQTAKNSKLGMWSDVCLQHDQENQDEESTNLEEKTEEQEENDFIPENYDIKIQHINYNPEGKDKDRETITLLSTTSLMTDKNFHLLINDRKKSLPRSNLQSGKDITIMGNFQFPNSKPTCVKLQYQDYTFDTYCYNPNDAQLDTELGTGTILTGQENTELEKLSATDLAILQITKLKRFDDQTCLLYNKQKITCIKTPKIKKNTKKTSSKKSKKTKKTKIKYKTIKPEAVQQIETELKYYKKFVQVLKSHLQDKRYPFYNQELKSYFLQLKTDKTNKVYDIATIQDYFEKTPKTLLDTRIQKNILEKIPAERKEKYWTLYDAYMEELNRQAGEV